MVFSRHISAVNLESSSILLRRIVPWSPTSLVDASAIEELTDWFVLVASHQQLFDPFYVCLEVQ